MTQTTVFLLILLALAVAISAAAVYVDKRGNARGASTTGRNRRRLTRR